MNSGRTNHERIKEEESLKDKRDGSQQVDCLRLNRDQALYDSVKTVIPPHKEGGSLRSILKKLEL